MKPAGVIAYWEGGNLIIESPHEQVTQRKVMVQRADVLDLLRQLDKVIVLEVNQDGAATGVRRR